MQQYPGIYNPPSEDLGRFSFVRFWRPEGTQTVLYVKNMTTGRYVNLLKWGNRLYLPVDTGEQIGIGIHNDSSNWAAYPTYIEAANLWVGGPAQPEDCSTDYMWELRPYQAMVCSHLVNPDSQDGRPLQIVDSGEGFTIGEATFGTEEFRGQMRVYKRRQLRVDPPPYRYKGSGGGYQSYPTRGAPQNESYSTRDVTPEGPPTLSGEALRGEGTRSKGINYGATRSPRAGIGAGAEEHVGHFDTSVSYERHSTLVAALFVEKREYLHQMLINAWGTGWDWWFNAPSEEHWWNNLTQDVSPSRPTAPHIPLAPAPHRPHYPGW